MAVQIRALDQFYGNNFGMVRPKEVVSVSETEAKDLIAAGLAEKVGGQAETILDGTAAPKKEAKPTKDENPTDDDKVEKKADAGAADSAAPVKKQPRNSKKQSGK